MRRLLLLLCFAALPLRAATRVVLLHFSDYHSHALPFYSEDRPDQGGIARAVGYLESQRRSGAVVLSGGDMVNKGSPSWSDKYQCVEWPWFNGIVDAMAVGNHDFDYGIERLEKCRAATTYPLLSANTPGFGRYKVITRKGIRIGVFAVAGPGLKSLVKTPGVTFGDSVEAAREVVRELRHKERVDVVVLIGHEATAEDESLSRAVPGIDIILGTHSHEKHDLTRIAGTDTWFIAPSQYLTYISRVELTFQRKKLTGVAGRLVRVDSHLTPDRKVAAEVGKLEQELESDRDYAELFRPIAVLRAPVPLQMLGARTVETMRAVAAADAAFSTSSSFRQPLAGGPLTMEALRNALPYDNDIVVKAMTGAELRHLIAVAEQKKGTDDYPYSVVPESVEEGRLYRVAVTDFMANVAVGYRDLLAGSEKTGHRVRDELRKALVAGDFDRPSF